MSDPLRRWLSPLLRLGATLATAGLIATGCQPEAGMPPAPVAPTPRVTVAPLEPTPTAPPPAANKRGVHLLLDDGNVQLPRDVWDDHLSWAARLIGRGGYVVQLIRSDDLDAAVWQPFFDAAARERLVPIVRLATHKSSTGDWWVRPETDADGLGYRTWALRVRRFLESIHWRVDMILVTVSNEPNRADEWGGAADPAAYARYLRDTSEALRSVSSVRVRVLNGALDPYAPSDPQAEYPNVDAERFMEQMERAVPGVLGSLDGWASHPYPLGPFIHHPRAQEYRIDDVRPDPLPRRAPPGTPNRGINGYAFELWKLRSLGVERAYPVYITESGWRHANSQVARSADSMNATVDDVALGQYIALAFDGPDDHAAEGWIPWNHDPRVHAVALFALGGRPELWGHTNLVRMDATGRIAGPFAFSKRLASVSPGRIACSPTGSC